MHGQEIFQVFTDLNHSHLGLCTGSTEHSSVIINSKTPFTRYRIRMVMTSSSGSLWLYLLLPFFLSVVVIKFCHIIIYLRAKLVLKLSNLIS